MKSLIEIIDQPWTLTRFLVVTGGAVLGLMSAMAVTGRWNF